MNESTDNLIAELRSTFSDADYRDSYAESFVNSFIAAQIKTLREQRDMTQDELARAVGTKQAGISRLENVNYSSWKVETLRKLARAYGLWLKVSFEEFGTLPREINRFSRANLQRVEFDKDPVFSKATHGGQGLPHGVVDSSSLGSAQKLAKSVGSTPTQTIELKKSAKSTNLVESAPGSSPQPLGKIAGIRSIRK